MLSDNVNYIYFKMTYLHNVTSIIGLTTKNCISLAKYQDQAIHWKRNKIYYKILTVKNHKYVTELSRTQNNRTFKKLYKIFIVNTLKITDKL